MQEYGVDNLQIFFTKVGMKSRITTLVKCQKEKSIFLIRIIIIIICECKIQHMCCVVVVVDVGADDDVDVELEEGDLNRLGSFGVYRSMKWKEGEWVWKKDWIHKFCSNYIIDLVQRGGG